MLALNLVVLTSWIGPLLFSRRRLWHLWFQKKMIHFDLSLSILNELEQRKAVVFLGVVYSSYGFLFACWFARVSTPICGHKFRNRVCFRFSAFWGHDQPIIFFSALSLVYSFHDIMYCIHLFTYLLQYFIRRNIIFKLLHNFHILVSPSSSLKFYFHQTLNGDYKFKRNDISH